MPNSATTVLPEPVGAATSTDSPAWRAWMARTWKSSSGKGKPAANRSMFMAASSVGGRQAAPERDAVLRGEDAAANQVFAEQAGERFGRLQVRQMPGALDDFQARSGDDLGHRAGGLGRDQGVARRRHHQGLDIDPGEVGGGVRTVPH